MPLIYRIQDAQGRGPYRPGRSHLWADSLHDLRNRTFMQESPWLTFKLRGTEDAFGCGFRYLEQLNKWFSATEMEKLGKLGYQVVMLDVDEILAESDNQLVFWRSKPLRKDVGRVIPLAARESENA